jgi:hypothetical protein
MKIRFFLITTVLLACFTTATFASSFKHPTFDQNHNSGQNQNWGQPISTHFEPRHSPVDHEVKYTNPDVKNLSEIKDRYDTIPKLCKKKDGGKDDDVETDDDDEDEDEEVSNVPVPAAVWLFGSGLLGLLGVKRKS